MGMDVYGCSATSEKGEYFRNNVWWWRPLAEYCCEVAPAITAKCTYWQSNDGDGLNARDARRLADALEKELREGRTAAYAAIRDAEHNQLPDEPCKICAGTGSRPEPPNIGAGTTGACNGCNSTGRKRPIATDYPFSVENVEQFVAFLRDCGGFKIC